MSQAKERLSELRDRGLITSEQYDELIAALDSVEPDVPAAMIPQVPAVPQPPSQPASPRMTIHIDTGDQSRASQSAIGTTGSRLMVRLISEDLRVRGVPGLTSVRVVNGQSSVHTGLNGDTVEIESALTGGEFHGFSLHFGSDSGDTVELEIPENMPCELKTVSGDISLENLRGALNVRSVSGDIDGRSLTHVQSATSTSGDLDLEQCLVDGDVVTKSGDVEMDSCTVHGMLKSYSGDASALDTVLNDVDVLSFSGDVHLEGVTIQGGARLKTTSGDIRAELDQHDVMVDVDTRSGEATVRGPGIDIQTSRQRIPVGLAAVELSAHTGSGDIDIRLT
ncbi:MAG TPA: DUF4097 family beta strand repeat-containing protein [Clostridia bacterium]|nr:DUF4097 family beta strand repeat-containing protein [Clostridia bacterium]